MLNEQNEVQPDNSDSLNSTFKNEVMVRSLSTNQICFDSFIYNRCFKSQMLHDKFESDTQFIEMKCLIKQYQRNVESKVNYFSILLKDTLNLINYFVDTGYSEFLETNII